MRGALSISKYAEEAARSVAYCNSGICCIVLSCYQIVHRAHIGSAHILAYIDLGEIGFAKSGLDLSRLYVYT